MEPLSLSNPAQLAAPKLANATVPIGACTDAGSGRQAFGQVMQQAVAASQTKNAPPPNSQSDSSPTLPKVPLSRSEKEAQHRPQDSPTDPAATNPISMALPNISIPPLTVAPQIAPNLASTVTPALALDLTPAVTPTLASNLASTVTPIVAPNLVSTVTPTLEANLASSLPPNPAPNAGPGLGQQSVNEPASSPNLPAASRGVSADLGAGLVIDPPSPTADPVSSVTLTTSATLAISPTRGAAPQIAGQGNNLQGLQTPVDAASLPSPNTGETAPVAADSLAVTTIGAPTAATPLGNSDVKGTGKPDASPSVASGPSRATAPQVQMPFGQTVQGVAPIPPPVPSTIAGSSPGSSPDQTATKKEIAKVALALPPLPHLAAASGTPIKSGPDAPSLGPASASSLEQKPAASTHSDSQDSSTNQNDSRNADTAAAAKTAPSSGPSHDSTQFSLPLLTATPQLRSDSAQAAPLAAATLAPSAPISDRSFVPTASAQNAPAPNSHVPLTAFQADSASGKFVTSAQLLGASGHSEMRVSLDTDKLGSVEVQARLTGDQLGAAIMVEKREAHAALAIELPALQQALSDKQLRVDQVALLHGSFSATTGESGASSKQDQPNASRNALGSTSTQSSLPAQFFAASGQTGIFDSRGHLSVHA